MLKRIFITMLFVYTGICLSDDLSDSAGPASEDTLVKTHELEKMVVTATRSYKHQKDVSTSVSILTEKEFDNLKPRSSTEMLEGLPGVFVHKTGAFGRADVTIRGVGNNGRQTMVLVDGRPVKMGLFGCAVTHSLPANNVKRVEVIRGPASVLYGSDAFGGVVNIITKRAHKKLEGDILASYGTENTQRYRGRVGGEIKKFDYYITADRQSSDGHLPNSEYGANDISAHTGLSILDNLHVSVTGKYFDGSKEEPEKANLDETTGLWKAGTGSETWNEYNRGYVDFTATWNLRSLSIDAKYYRNMGRHEFNDGFESTDYTNGITAHGKGRLFEESRFKNEPMVGIEFRNMGGELLHDPFPYENPEREFSRNEFGVFIFDEQTLFDRVIFSGGLRYNYDKCYGGIVVPQGGIVVPVRPEFRVRGSISKGFRAPQINDLFMMKASNEDLKPEENINYEGGIYYEFADKSHLDVAVFYTEGENMIQRDSVGVIPGTTIPRYQFRNSGTYTMKGVEAGLCLAITNSLNIKVAYSYLDLYDKAKGVPQNKFDILLNYHSKPFSATIGGRYLLNYFADDAKTKRLDSESGTLTAFTRMSYTIWKRVNLFVTINNILNRNYAQYADMPGSGAGVYLMPGIDISGGLTISF